MTTKRKDTKGRILRDGEIQKADGRYEYRYYDVNNCRRSIYSWRLTETDVAPEGKRDCQSLREMERQLVLENVGNGYYLFSSDAITQSGTTLTAALNDARYLYYAGTATGKPILSFAIHPVIDSSEAYVVDITYNDEMSLIWAGDDETGSGARIKDGNDYGAYIYLARAADQGQSESSDTFYISEPRNKFLYDTNPYNTITIKDNDDNILNVFKFTLPSLYTGYNQAIEIFDTYGKTVDSLIELKTKIKEGVKETYSRAWATAIINYLMVVKNSDVIEDINNQVPSSAMKK